MAGAVLPASTTSIPLLLSLLGSDQTEEPPVVIVDSTEPECKISLLTEAFVTRCYKVITEGVNIVLRLETIKSRNNLLGLSTSLLLQ